MAAHSYSFGEKSVTNGGYMSEQITLNDDGTFQIVTHIFTHVALKGFTGGYIAIFSDAAGNMLHRYGPNHYGVDGVDIPFGVSDRTLVDNGQVPGGGQNVYKIDMIYSYMPENRFWTDLATAIPAALTKIGEFITWVENWYKTVFGPAASVTAGPTVDQTPQTTQMLVGNNSVWHGVVTGVNKTPAPPLQPLAVPTLGTPADGAQVSSRNVTFTWHAVPNATAYVLHVQQISVHVEAKTQHEWQTYGTIESKQAAGTSLAFNLPASLGSTMRWGVAAIDGTGHYGTSSSAWRSLES